MTDMLKGRERDIESINPDIVFRIGSEKKYHADGGDLYQSAGSRGTIDWWTTRCGFVEGEIEPEGEDPDWVWMGIDEADALHLTPCKRCYSVE